MGGGGKVWIPEAQAIVFYLVPSTHASCNYESTEKPRLYAAVLSTRIVFHSSALSHSSLRHIKWHTVVMLVPMRPHSWKSKKGQYRHENLYNNLYALHKLEIWKRVDKPSQTSLIRSSFIRIPRHPEENRWLPMCSICYAYNITGPRDSHTGAWFCAQTGQNVHKKLCCILLHVACRSYSQGVVRANEVFDLLDVCGQHSVACTCHFSRLFYILCTLVVLHRTRLHVCTMSLLLTCPMHIQSVCSVIRFPRLTGYILWKTDVCG